MSVFVNGRTIQNRSLLFALEEAYSGFLMQGRHPVAAIHLTVSARRGRCEHPSREERGAIRSRPGGARRAVSSGRERAAGDATQRDAVRMSRSRPGVRLRRPARCRPDLIAARRTAHEAPAEPQALMPGLAGAARIRPVQQHLHHCGGTGRALHDRSTCRPRARAVRPAGRAAVRRDRAISVVARAGIAVPHAGADAGTGRESGAAHPAPASRSSRSATDACLVRAIPALAGRGGAGRAGVRGTERAADALRAGLGAGARAGGDGVQSRRKSRQPRWTYRKCGSWWRNWNARCGPPPARTVAPR